MIATQSHLSQVVPTSSPPPDPDLIFVGFTGLPGVLETLAVIAVTGAATWTGIRAAQTSREPYAKAVGWVGGVGSALLGLLYLGTKTGITGQVGLPTVRVAPY